MMMTYRLIRYRTRPDQADENQKRVEAVFAELKARAPQNVRYLVLRGADGRFFHLVGVESGSDASPVTSLPAFSEFQKGLAERIMEPPESSDVTIVGNHRMLPGQHR